jgi:hypothetical protein
LNVYFLPLEYFFRAILSKKKENCNNKFRIDDSSFKIDFSKDKLPSVLNRFYEVPKALNRALSTLDKSSIVVEVFLSDKSID